MNHIFLHLSKTGGMSLRRVLMENIPEHFLTQGFPNSFTPESFDGVTSETKLVLGHMLFGVHAHLPDPEKWRYFTMLRNPVDRVMSHWAWHERYGYEAGNIALWNSGRKYTSLDDWISSPEFTQSHNLMTRVLSGHVSGKSNSKEIVWASDGEDRYNEAIYNINKWFKFVGCLECLDYSLDCIQNMLMLPPFDFPWVGKAPNSVQPTKEQRTKIIRENIWDWELYLYCENKFDWNIL